MYDIGPVAYAAHGTPPTSFSSYLSVYLDKWKWNHDLKRECQCQLVCTECNEPRFGKILQSPNKR